MQTHLRRAAEAAQTAAQPSEAVPDQLVVSAEVRSLAGGISDMTLWRWVRKGIVPRPLVIERRRYWRRAELIASLEAAAERSRQAAEEGAE